MSFTCWESRMETVLFEWNRNQLTLEKKGRGKMEIIRMSKNATPKKQVVISDVLF